MDRACRQLWVSSLQETQENPTDRFDTIVSVCQDTCEDNVSDDTEYAHVPLADDCENQREWGGAFDVETFDEAVKKVVQRLFEDKTVLIHCHRGRNRSVAVAAASHAIWRDTTLTRGMGLVFDARDVAQPTDEMRAFARHAVGNNLRGYPR